MAVAERIAHAHPARQVAVWDPLLRLFHWSLVASFATALFLTEGGSLPHRYAGYVAGGLVVFRILWGFIGPRHARFRDFVPSPRRLLSYLADLVRRREPRTLGHNPAGAVMVLGLLAITLLLAATGWLMTTDAFYGVRWVEDLHEGAANAAQVMIVAHVAGVLFASLRHKENLVLSMITGRKRS